MDEPAEVDARIERNRARGNTAESIGSVSKQHWREAVAGRASAASHRGAAAALARRRGALSKLRPLASLREGQEEACVSSPAMES